MNAHDATLEVIDEFDGSLRMLTNSMGAAPNSLNNVLRRNSTPRTDTLVKIADVCGYDLVLRRRVDGYEILIDETDD